MAAETVTSAGGARIFSYGTLITGALSPAVDAALARHCVRRWEGSVKGQLFDLGPYPGALPAARREERVFGQVLELADAARVLPILDHYEGYNPRAPRDSLYIREWVRVVPVAGGGPVSAWIYWLNHRPPAGKRIPSGDYRVSRTSSRQDTPG